MNQKAKGPAYKLKNSLILMCGSEVILSKNILGHRAIVPKFNTFGYLALLMRLTAV